MKARRWIWYNKVVKILFANALTEFNLTCHWWVCGINTAQIACNWSLSVNSVFHGIYNNFSAERIEKKITSPNNRKLHLEYQGHGGASYRFVHRAKQVEFTLGVRCDRRRMGFRSSALATLMRVLWSSNCVFWSGRSTPGHLCRHRHAHAFFIFATLELATTWTRNLFRSN